MSGCLIEKDGIPLKNKNKEIMEQSNRGVNQSQKETRKEGERETREREKQSQRVGREIN